MGKFGKDLAVVAGEHANANAFTRYELLDNRGRHLRIVRRNL